MDEAPIEAARGAGPALAVPVALFLAAVSALRERLENLPPPDDEGYHDRLVTGLREALPPLYDAYDAYLRAVLAVEKRAVTCSRGCSACCRHFVSSVEPFELIALDHALKARADYPDLVVSNFNKSSLYTEILRGEGDGGDAEAEDRALYRYFLRGRKCSFLEADGTCGVYEWRPMSCRMFFAESPPRFCAGKELATPWNRNFQIELPVEAEEALARCSRLLGHLQLPEHLFPGLVEVNGLFGRYPASEGPSSAAPS